MTDQTKIMLEQLRSTCRKLLADGTVRVVIGYGQTKAHKTVHPVFITRAEQAERLTWNRHCQANLVTYLHREDVRALGKPAIIVKACDERALTVLQQESQLGREDLVVIGIACDGDSRPRMSSCDSCQQRVPRGADILLGDEPATTSVAADPYASLDALLARPPDSRMAYWQAEFSRCTKCYACRQICPLCYCRRCIVDKNRPVVIDPSATLRGNFAWQITRAFHLAGRCVGCDACTRGCPAGIDLRLLNLAVARAAEEHFDFRAGVDPQQAPLIGSYSETDQEIFIR